MTIVDVACSSQGLTIAPLYDSLSPNAVEYIVQEANIKVAFVQDDKVPKMIEVMEQCPMLKLVVVMGSKDLNTVGDFPEHERVITLCKPNSTRFSAAFVGRERASCRSEV